MRALLDVNGIIALLDSAQVMHASACSWLERNLDQGWATCPLTQTGVMRIMAQPAYPNTQPALQVHGATAGHLRLIPADGAGRLSWWLPGWRQHPLDPENHLRGQTLSESSTNPPHVKEKMRYFRSAW